ncbi:MAG: glycosyltransferase family 9 protein [Candidatus Omnitrophica bacterium]|nr:glycosyltransferase family 9 protein [Candidatus Omnitrophota bacterium]
MLRAEKFDLVLDFKDTLLPYLLGKPSNNWWLNRQARKIPSRYERYQHIIKLLHLPTVDFSYLPLYVREDNDRLMRKLHSKGLFNVQNILLISPGARFLMKRWPARYFAALISSIVKKEEMAVILVGDDFDCAAAHEIEPLLTNMDVINLCGKITQKELAILVERARLVISNDSATMHFASFYKRPVVGIFGPTNVAKYGSSLPTARIARLDLHCIPCEESICKYKRECLEKLTPEKVLPLALELLQKTI